jgi:4-hydroxy-2-oxoglutarate aldolase
MTSLDLSGIIPPIPTPFKDGRVDRKALARNVVQWSQTGIRGLLALGSNGEYVYLSEAEKRLVVEAVVRAAPDDMVVMVGSGCESTAESIRLTADCAAMGAHCALVVTPSYYAGRMTPEALEAHFTAVADAAAIPTLLYNVPKFTGINLTAGSVMRLSRHPNILGIKDSTGNVAQLGTFLNDSADDFQVLVGTAGALFSALSLGCTGGILALANVAPEACVRIHRLVAAGDMPAARDLQRKMIPVNQAVTSTYGIPGLKAALDMRGYAGGDPRPPLMPLGAGDRENLKGVLARAGLL